MSQITSSICPQKLPSSFDFHGISELRGISRVCHPHSELGSFPCILPKSNQSHSAAMEPSPSLLPPPACAKFGRARHLCLETCRASLGISSLRVLASTPPPHTGPLHMLLPLSTPLSWLNPPNLLCYVGRSLYGFTRAALNIFRTVVIKKRNYIYS